MIWRRALLISSKIMNSITNKAPGTGTVETAHVASIDSISFVIVYMNLHRWAFVFFLIVQDCTGGMKRCVVAVVHTSLVCMSVRSTVVFRRVLSRLYGIFDAAENPLKFEIIVYYNSYINIY
jgi:hypothetical protein